MMPDGSALPDGDFVPGAENSRAFRDALGKFATGIAVITTTGPEGPVGFTANSFASVSMDPPLVLWSPAKSSSRFQLFAKAQNYSIHILCADQAAICSAFVRGGSGFEGLDVSINATGNTIISNTLARFDCVQHAAHDGGDHLIIVGRVLCCAMKKGDPLIFSQGGYGAFNPLG
jgi:flavin reductase (DIM6/NTAB) family NADH-FMN oxidoreductase RutF